jgi:HAD superfamily hydrolase (TIGR01490 family)
MNTAAFFDIDGTLYRDSLLIEHFRKLVQYEVLDPILWHGSVKNTYENWKKRRGNYDDYLFELVDIYRESLKGLEKSKMEFITGQVIDLKGDKVYMYTRQRIQWHKEQGHFVFFISGSPDYLVHKMAERYGITDCVGTKYLLDDEEKYTGEVEKMWDSESKDRAIRSFVDRYKIDLKSSFAYGDTSGDLSMFHFVEHPVAINPTRELLSILKDDKQLKGKVRVVVERKDVIYMLDPDVEICCPEIGE